MHLRKMGFIAALVSASLFGCAGTKESASKDTLTANVGVYPPAPSNITKPRVGVPPFNVKAQGNMQGGDLDSMAADQMTTLLDQSGRFDVIERAQLQKLMDEQNMEGIVKPGELAKTGQVRGVDYLLLGKVTNLRLKKEQTKKGFNLAGIGGLINTHGASTDTKETRIKTECGVDIRLVDPTTGKIWVSNFSEFTREDSASAMGLSIFGASAESDANIDVSEDDKGKILRLALDEAVRKSLPKIDKFLTSGSAKSSGGSAGAVSPAQAPAAQTAAPAPAATPAAPSNSAVAAPAAPAAAKKFCAQCGKEVAAGAKFCASCGAKAE
ncbi:MAG TPA: CsgG/HfaB family protein [Tepidisphaeraceae bacterium]